MSEITFTEVEIPTKAKAGRTAMPNPFEGKFPSDDKALMIEIPEERGSVEANRIERQARTAAKAVDRTARILIEDVEDAKGKPKGTRFTIWTIERQVRKSSKK